MVQTRSQTRAKQARQHTPRPEKPAARGVWAALCTTNVPWGTRRSPLIGGSALAYLAPAALDAARAPPHRRPARAALFAAQALACFWSGRARASRRHTLSPPVSLSLADDAERAPSAPALSRSPPRSDYVDTGRFAASHAIDRVLAPLMVVAVIGAGLARVGVGYVVLVALPTLATHHLSGRARRLGAFGEYALWHAAWHCLGGVAASLTLALAAAAPPAADGVDRALAAACARSALLRALASGPCAALASS